MSRFDHDRSSSGDIGGSSSSGGSSGSISVTTRTSINTSYESGRSQPLYYPKSAALSHSSQVHIQTRYSETQVAQNRQIQSETQSKPETDVATSDLESMGFGSAGPETRGFKEGCPLLGDLTILNERRRGDTTGTPMSQQFLAGWVVENCSYLGASYFMTHVFGRHDHVNNVTVVLISWVWISLRYGVYTNH